MSGVGGLEIRNVAKSCPVCCLLYFMLLHGKDLSIIQFLWKGTSQLYLQTICFVLQNFKFEFVQMFFVSLTYRTILEKKFQMTSPQNYTTDSHSTFKHTVLLVSVSTKVFQRIAKFSNCVFFVTMGPYGRKS